jgi:hypothetical protein
VLEVAGVICGSLIYPQNRVVLLKFLGVKVCTADSLGS